MDIKPKHIIIGALTVGVGAFAYKALQAQSVASSLQVNVKAGLPSVGFSGLKIPLSVTIENPKGGRLTITRPFVELREKAEDTLPFAVSDVGGQEVVLEPFGRTSFEVTFLIPLLTLATKAVGIYRQAVNEGKITVHIRAKSYANILGVKIPSEQDDYMSIAIPQGVKNLLPSSSLGSTKNPYAYASITKQTA